MNDAQCAAASVSGEILQSIDVGEEGSEDYNAIIDELAVFRDNADIEYIYTLRKVGEEQFVFVVDSDPEEPGAIGDECEATQGLSDAFSQGITAGDEEPFTDEWGSHLSAYSPIFVDDGIAGAGFAIVATEVGQLSNEIDSSVAEITEINAQILSAVETLTSVLDEMVTFVSTDVAKDYDSFAALGQEYGSTTSAIRTGMSDIGRQSTEISDTISRINDSVGEITRNVALVSASADELTSSTRLNTEHSRELNRQVSKYSF